MGARELGGKPRATQNATGMKLHRLLFVTALLAVIAGLFMASPSANADVSNTLRQTLATLRGLGGQSFGSVAQWARNGAPQVVFPVADYEQAETQILSLPGDDRQAVLWWLQGNGRSALYARGATDDMIGPLRAGVDSGATPAPALQWRDLRLASPTLGATGSGAQIVLLNGFAAAMLDGRRAVACVSFKNVAPQAATRVIFIFTLLNSDGRTGGELTLDRQGTFSPNIGIMSYDSYSDWVSHQSINRGYAQNCATVSNGVAAVPILTARYVTYRVTRVEYVDGSSWESTMQPAR